MEKVWLKSYPKGVPAEIDPSEFMSVGEVFERSCREFAERDAYVAAHQLLRATGGLNTIG